MHNEPFQAIGETRFISLQRTLNRNDTWISWFNHTNQAADKLHSVPRINSKCLDGKVWMALLSVVVPAIRRSSFWLLLIKDSRRSMMGKAVWLKVGLLVSGPNNTSSFTGHFLSEGRKKGPSVADIYSPRCLSWMLNLLSFVMCFIWWIRSELLFPALASVALCSQVIDEMLEQSDITEGLKTGRSKILSRCWTLISPINTFLRRTIFCKYWAINWDFYLDCPSNSLLILSQDVPGQKRWFMFIINNPEQP